MSIRTLINELHVEDTCWNWDRDRALSVWVNAADDIAMRWLTVSSSSSSPLPSSRRCCCRCCWVPSYQLGRHAHCPACLRRQNPSLPGWQRGNWSWTHRLFKVHWSANRASPFWAEDAVIGWPGPKSNESSQMRRTRLIATNSRRSLRHATFWGEFGPRAVRCHKTLRFWLREIEWNNL